MAYKALYPRIPKTHEDWREVRFVDDNKFHLEQYENWYSRSVSFCVKLKDDVFEVPQEVQDTIESEFIQIHVYMIKNVPTFRYYTIITWCRIPNHWEG